MTPPLKFIYFIWIYTNIHVNTKWAQMSHVKFCAECGEKVLIFLPTVELKT
jgi:hypothetical protein